MKLKKSHLKELVRQSIYDTISEYKEDIKESTGKRCTVKEVKKWFKTLEENRYKKTYASDARRVSWLVNNNLNSRRNYDRSMKIEQHALSSPFHNREVIRHKRGKEQKYDMWIRAHYQGTLVQRDDRIKRDTLRQKDDSEEVKGRNLKNVTVFGLLTVAAIVSFCLKKVKERKVYS